jgi:DNA modification methylase
MADKRDYQFMPPLNVHEYGALREDIKRNGVRVPIEYDEDGNVLDGLHRLKICKELGITDYPTVIRGDLTEEEKIAHVFSLNAHRRHLSDGQKTAIVADLLRVFAERSDGYIASMVSVSQPFVSKLRRDMESAGQLKTVMSSIGKDGKKRKRQRQPLRSASIFQTTEKGRNKAMRESKEILEAAKADPERYVDLWDQVVETGRTHNPHGELKKRRRAEETERKAKTAKESNLHRVIQADNMRMIDDESVHLICADPPYNISWDREVTFADDSRKGWSRNIADWDHLGEGFTGKLLHWTEEFYRVLKPGGSVYVFCAEAFISELRSKLIISGFKFKNVLTWHFTNPRPKTNKTSWITAADHILFAVKNGGHTFNWTSVSDMHSVITTSICQGNERRDHPTQKPLELTQKLIRVSSNPGDVVLDCFAGTGTVGEACQKLKRSFILIECVPEYIQIIEERTGVKHENDEG